METYTFASIIKVSIFFLIWGIVIGLVVMFFFARNNPKIIQQVYAKLKVEFDEREKALRAETDKLKEQVARFEMRKEILSILAELGIKKE